VTRLQVAPSRAGDRDGRVDRVGWGVGRGPAGLRALTARLSSVAATVSMFVSTRVVRLAGRESLLRCPNGPAFMKGPAR
jgi:hypothetical protein